MFLYYHCDLKEKTNENEKGSKDGKINDTTATMKELMRKRYEKFAFSKMNIIKKVYTWIAISGKSIIFAGWLS